MTALPICFSQRETAPFKSFARGFHQNRYRQNRNSNHLLNQYIRSDLGRFTRSNPSIRIYTREVNRLRAEATATLDGTRQRLTTLNRQITNIVDTVAAGRASPALLDSLEKLETEKNHLERDLARISQTRLGICRVEPLSGGDGGDWVMLGRFGPELIV